MDEICTLAAFKATNEEIKAALLEMDEKISEHPYLDCNTVNENNEAFIEILDQLLEMRSTIEKLKIRALKRDKLR